MITPPLLKLDNVSFHPPHVNPIIDRIRLEINSHDFIVLLGGNGSGKSTLIKLINRTYKPTQGHIYFQDKLLDSYSFQETGLKIATLSQSAADSLFMDLTIEENAILIEKALSQNKFHKKKFLSELKDYLHEFNVKLSLSLKTPVNRLSGGEQQILAFALYLRNKPDLLLLDEHTSALDPKTSTKIIEFTNHIIEKYKITCLMTTHNLDYALKYGSRLLAINSGKIIYEANKDQKSKLEKSSLLEYCY